METFPAEIKCPANLSHSGRELGRRSPPVGLMNGGDCLRKVLMSPSAEERKERKYREEDIVLAALGSYHFVRRLVCRYLQVVLAANWKLLSLLFSRPSGKELEFQFNNDSHCQSRSLVGANTDKEEIKKNVLKAKSSHALWKNKPLKKPEKFPVFE